jgi:MFS family permease
MKSFGVLADKPFRMLWLARSSSAIGTAFANVALVFAVLDIGGTALSLGLVLTAGTLTQLVLLLLGGVLADRLPRRQVMVWADLVRAVAQGTMAVLLLTGGARLWELVLANMLLSGAAALFRPASTGIVAQAVRGDQLQAANALLTISERTAAFAGPALSGLLVAVAGPGWSFAIDAVSFAVSALLLGAMPALTGTAAVARGLMTEFAEGWREVVSRKWYLFNLAGHALWNLGIAGILVLGPVIANQRLHGAAGWGLISASFSGGAVLGGLVSLRIKPRRPLFAGNLALVLGGLLALALAGHLPLYDVMLCAAAAFAGMNFLNSVWQTVMQQLIPEQVLSRVSSYDYLVSYLIMPAGYAFVGPVASAAGVDITLVFAAVFMIVPSVVLSFLPAVRGIQRDREGMVSGPPPAARPGELQQGASVMRG